jgi:hypothetical protein
MTSAPSTPGEVKHLSSQEKPGRIIQPGLHNQETVRQDHRESMQDTII